MTSDSRYRMRALVPAVAALVVLGLLFTFSRQPALSSTAVKKVATSYKFTQMPIAMPPGYHAETRRSAR